MDEKQLDIPAIYRENLQAVIAAILPQAIAQYGEPHTISLTLGFTNVTLTHDIRVIATSEDDAEGDGTLNG